MSIADTCLAQTSSGPIRLHPENPHWFEFDGKATALITSAEHYGAVINGDFNYRRYLETLRESGLNYTRIFAGPFVEPPGAHGIDQNTLAPDKGSLVAPWVRSDVAGYIGGGNKFDLNSFSPDYLKRLNSFIKTASENGIVVELTFFSSNYKDELWRQSPLHPANNIQSLKIEDWKTNQTTNNSPELMLIQEKLVRWLVRKLNHHDNLFFEIQNEPWSDNHTMGEMVNPYMLDKPKWPNAVQITSPESVQWQQKIAEFIRDEEKALPKKHLVAQNVANFRLPLRDSDLIEADIFNFHYAYPETVRWNFGLNHVIGFDESGFAGPEDRTYRRQAWNFVLSGGALFNHLDYSFAVSAEDGSKPISGSPGGGSDTLRKQIGALSRFIHSFDLAKLRPIEDFVAHSPGVVTRTLGTEAKQYAVYLEGRGPTTLRLRLPEGEWKLQWISVLSGNVIASKTIESTGVTTDIASPDFENEIALRLVAE